MGTRIVVNATNLVDMSKYNFEVAGEKEAIAAARYHDLTERRDVLETLVIDAETQNRNNAARFIAQSLGTVRQQIEKTP